MSEKQKVVLFPFSDDVMCFIHVLLNGLDFHENGDDVKIVVEGGACTVIPQIAESTHGMNPLYKKAKEKGLFAGVCKACATKLRVSDPIKAEGLPLIGDMSGHPSMRNYMEQGYRIITF